MSVTLGKLCSLILQEHYGETVCIVGTDLFTSYGKTLQPIIKSTNLLRSEVTHALAILIKFRLAKFEPSQTNENIAEYSLVTEKVLLLLRFSRYVHHIQAKFGPEAAFLTEELLRSGHQIASIIISKAFTNVENKEQTTLIQCRDRFMELVSTNYFIRAPYVPVETLTNVPKLESGYSTLFSCPEIDVQDLIHLQKGAENIKLKDADIFWMVNFEKFHQEFRDSIMISAIERKIGANAGECFKYILMQMNTSTDTWQANSNPIGFAEIKQACNKKSNNLEMIRYLDQYISVIFDDKLQFLSKYGDAGGGQYVVEMKTAFEQLTWNCIENIIIEKFGSKAARIFRVVQKKKYIEQEEIQKEAMVPAKEAKLLTYQLLQEHFLQIQIIRKTGGGGAGPAKAYYLFYVNQNQIVSMLLETCYKALFNAITRSIHDKEINKRLIDKSQRLESIVEAMKDRGESEEYISEILETLTPPEREILLKFKVRVKNLYSAEIGLDETIYLLQLCQYYSNAK